MRVLVLYAHPVDTSYQAALHQTVVDGLTAAGHEVDDCDLYAEDFDPVLCRAERLDYHDEELCRKPVEAYVERLLAAEALVLNFPVWNYGFPAIMKGFFDRVFLPGVSFEIAGGRVRPTLHNIRRLVTVTTYGGDRWRTMLMGDPPRKVITRSLRGLVHPVARSKYLALYDMNRCDLEARKRFIDRVDRTVRSI